MIVTKQKIKSLISVFYRDISALGSFDFHIILILIFLAANQSTVVKLLSINLIASFIISYTIRSIHFIDRPNKRKWNTRLEKIDASSFPSTHAIRSFGGAICIGLYFESSYLLYLLMLIAFFISHSRVFLKEHHPRDIIVGTVIGISLGMIIFHLV